MHYVEYKNTYDQFVSKYNVPSVNISQITSVKNELRKGQIATESLHQKQYETVDKVRKE
jgi:hypothetical protein